MQWRSRSARRTDKQRILHAVQARYLNIRSSILPSGTTLSCSFPWIVTASSKKGTEKVEPGVTEKVTAIVKEILEEIMVAILDRHLARALQEITAAYGEP